MTRSGRKLNASPASTPAAIHQFRRRPTAPSRLARSANTALHSVSGESAVPGHRGERHRRHHVEDGERADRGGGGPAPRPRQGEQPEDDPEVLQQAERPLGRQGVAEQLVPAGQDVQRPRAVEVQEVDVGHVAASDELGEVEHEALFHRPAGEAVEPAQRDRHQHPDDGDAEPRPDGALGPAPQAAGTTEHEGGRVVGPVLIDDLRAEGGSPCPREGQTTRAARRGRAPPGSRRSGGLPSRPWRGRSAPASRRRSSTRSAGARGVPRRTS